MKGWRARPAVNCPLSKPGPPSLSLRAMRAYGPPRRPSDGSYRIISTDGEHRHQQGRWRLDKRAGLAVEPLGSRSHSGSPDYPDPPRKNSRRACPISRVSSSRTGYPWHRRPRSLGSERCWRWTSWSVALVQQSHAAQAWRRLNVRAAPSATVATQGARRQRSTAIQDRLTCVTAGETFKALTLFI